MSEAPTATKGPASPFNRNNPYASRLRENVRLNKSGSAKDTRHIVIELGSAGPAYACGDSLGVLPRNPDHLVDEFLRKLGLTGDASLREILAATFILNLSLIHI
ncbi:MAG: hypothetical protein EBZ83_03815 [Verrucomicrobia bacterium]|nr:hypothetical protein [Verrucomicrobiota bacterium]NDF17117.1 hypothetical protein [Verrucomicrobiota bacterium]